MKRFKLTSAVAICLSLLGLAHSSYGQQASWKFEVLNNNITPAAVGNDLLVQNASEATDKWFGPVLEFVDPGGSFAIDPQYLDSQSNQGNVSFWLQTARAGSDATWQRLLSIHSTQGAREEIYVSLRWNRFIVQKYATTIFDTQNNGTTAGQLERLKWHHISINFNQDFLEI